MKIIYLFLRRHCYKGDERLFYFSAFSNKGWSVEKWSAVNWTFDGLVQPVNIDTSSDCFYIDDKNKLIENLERIKSEHCYFLIYPYDEEKCSWEIRKYIKKYGFKFSVMNESLEIASWHDKKPLTVNVGCLLREEFLKFKNTLVQVIKDIIKHRKINYLSKRIRNACMPFIYKSDKNFVTTNLVYFSYPNVLEALSKRNVLLHSQSYDEMLECKKIPTVIEGRFVVFIDQFLSGHSDFVKTGWNYPVLDKADYCSKLCTLFANIERDYNCRVIIAAHPKAEYDGEEFEGREIIIGKTNQLIKESLFCLIHTSTCFGLITALKKSFINIYDSLFFENCPEFKNFYVSIKNMFNCKQLDIGDCEQISNYKDYITEYNRDNYHNYNCKYVISGGSINPNVNNYEKIEEILRERL